MPSTESRGELLTPYDLELRNNLRTMNNQVVQHNPISGNLGNGVELQSSGFVNENVHVLEILYMEMH